jgi:hypothetical protein
VVDMLNILVEDVKEVGLQWGGSSPHTWWFIHSTMSQW